MAMTTPIRPSLAQLLGTPQAMTPRPQAVDANARDPLAAQRNFFRQAMGQAAAPQPASQAVAPATFKAADVMRATSAPAPQAASANSEQAIQRPGSYLNIRV